MTEQTQLCPQCKAIIKENSKFCGSCGFKAELKDNRDNEPQSASTFQETRLGGTQYVEKTKAATTLWAIFLGGFGAHHFYLGKKVWGILYLVFCWTYIPFIIAMVEWIRYIRMSDEKFYSKLEMFSSKGTYAFFW